MNLSQPVVGAGLRTLGARQELGDNEGCRLHSPPPGARSIGCKGQLKKRATVLLAEWQSGHVGSSAQSVALFSCAFIQSQVKNEGEMDIQF